MNIYIGADHRGFALKNVLAAELKNEGYTVIDVGAATLVEGDDYPDFARAVAENVAQDTVNRRGIVICGSGFGVDITANKVMGIRAALAMSPDHISQGRHDDDVNVLALAADFIEEEDAKKIMKVFLATPAAKDERYLRRQEEIREVEVHNK
jgi:ribose 5-phosphate isomerase B